MNKRVELNMGNLEEIYSEVRGEILDIKRSNRDENGNCETVVVTTEGKVVFVDHYDDNSSVLPVDIHNKILRELFLGLKLAN